MKSIPNTNEQINNRINKMNELYKNGEIVYKEKWDKKETIDKTLERNEHDHISTAGRLMSMRKMGKLIFAHIQDYTGKIQIAFEKKTIGEDQFDYIKKYIDIADFLGVTGEIFVTKTGEKTILVDKFALLSKTLRPLPEKFHGIKDKESCYRQRYLDLNMNKDSVNRFRKRTKLLKLVRKFLDEHQFLEVETPLLHPKKSGALATPFKTHHNALDIDIFLRIAPETYLKRCIAAGIDRVYDLGKNFRNEGMDPTHLPEFTMLEFYASYWNYEDLMDFTQNLLQYVVKELTGSLKITYQGTEIDFSGEWPRYSFRELIQNNCGIDIEAYKTADELRDELKKQKLFIDGMESMGLGNLIDNLYKKVARTKMIQPQFLINHPKDISPLARRNDTNPKITDRFQLVVNTAEVVNAYSELIDPIDQRERFEVQAEANIGGDEDAMVMDENYLLCMEHGMPPIAGCGIGLDRFFSILTDVDNLRDVVLFPLMRPIDNQEVKADKFPSLKDFNISKDEAMKLIKEHLKKENMISHSLASGAVMKGLAKHFKQDENKWEVLGLLHDLDYELTDKDEKQHGLKVLEMLKDYNLPKVVENALSSHNEMTGVSRNNGLDICLAAGETITGLIVATTLVYPDKKLSSVKVKSILKRMKKKDFAKSVNRDNIKLIEETGLKLEDFAAIALESMRNISDDLGL